MGAIRMHWNINNGHAGLNERLNKEDKPHYARTNKDMTDYSPASGVGRGRPHCSASHRRP